MVDVLLRQERLCETLGVRQRQLRIAEELITLLAPLGASPKLAEAYLRQGDVCTLLRRFDAADRALTTALRMCRERADRAAERNVLRSIGLSRSHAGRHEEAIASFEHALAIDRELGEEASASADLASLGNMFRKVGRHAEALEALEGALRALTPDANWMKRSAVKVVVACVYRELGDLDTALAYLAGLEQEAVERMNPIQASFALMLIAHIQLQQGRVNDSLETYRRAVDFTRRGGHTEGLVQSLRAAGEVLFGLGRYAEALAPLREAAGLFAQLEDREAEALMWRRIATARERCGDPTDARAAWESACELCRARGDVRGEVHALEGVARTTRAATGPEASVPHYEEVLRRAVQIGDRERELSLRNSLGILRWEMGAYAAALAQYEEALRVCRNLGDEAHEGLVLNSIGATLLRLQRLEEARTALEQAARVNAATGHRQLEAHSLAALGEACLAIGHADEARTHVEESLTLRRQLGDRRGEGWMHERLARVLEAQGLEGDADAARAAAARIAREVGDDALGAALETPVANAARQPAPR
jgi:tetratricopeptide (TPR) repeat protein